LGRKSAQIFRRIPQSNRGSWVETQQEPLLQRAIAIFEPYYLEHCMDQTVPYPGVVEMLEFLRFQKKVLVSNKPYTMVLKTVKHLKWEKYFELILGGDSTRNKKPHPEPILKALNFLGLDPKSALMIGDGTTDIQAAKAAGLATCAVTYGYRSKTELERWNPDFLIDQLQDLKNILEVKGRIKGKGEKGRIGRRMSLCH
jgi:phosphoglycolate phosphatase